MIAILELLVSIAEIFGLAHRDHNPPRTPEQIEEDTRHSARPDWMNENKS